ncbi:MAG: hypothetical protein P4M11_05730 [Candidatus Pacebacteria bacterium]|nr:hypothetical protein [Candidatus Paceibacterota bacterium]
MITNEELQDWQKDIQEATQTHPNAFANGPFLRAIFRATQQISVVEQRLVSLTKAVRDTNDSMIRFTEIIEKSIESSNKLASKLFWLNVVLALATGIGAIATAIIAFHW